MTRSQPLLVLSIDVEEDMPGWEVTPEVTTHNVSALPAVVRELRGLGVRTTLLCNYPVLADRRSGGLLRELARQEDCELGTHLHAWNTPPVDAVWEEREHRRGRPYYQTELPDDALRAKLERLHALATEVGCRAPTSFRAGRFGIDGRTLATLVELGYRVDSSVIPMSEHVVDGGPDHRDAPQPPYFPSRDDPTRSGDLPILEIPLSVGLSRSVPRWVQRLYTRLPKRLHLCGLLSSEYLGLLDFAWLYPARFELAPMCRVVDVLVARDVPVLNVFLHSSELVAGVSGRVRTAGDVADVVQRLKALLEHCLQQHDARPATLTEAADLLAPQLARSTWRTAGAS